MEEGKNMMKAEFYEVWLKNFASDIPISDIKRYVKSTGNYLWHIFSWNLIPESRYQSGQKAKEAFDKADKRGSWYINWFKDDRAHQIVPELKNADCFDQFVEVYVVAKNFEWTYIKTHESECGPYFMKR